MPRLNDHTLAPQNEAPLSGHDRASDPQAHVKPIPRTQQTRSSLRTYLGSFALANGTRGTLHMNAGSSCEVINFVISSFPSLHSCSVRCVQ